MEYTLKSGKVITGAEIEALDRTQRVLTAS